MPAVLVRDPRADGLGLLADLVAGLAVRGHSGHLDGCAVDDDLHLVDVVLAQAGVLQPDLVQCAGDGGEVLVDGASGFGGDHFRVGVAVHAVLLEFDRFRAVLQSALVVAAFLVGLPCKFGLVETGPVHPGGEIGVGVFRVPHVLAVVRVDACVCVRHVAWRVNGLPSAVGQVVESAVDELPWIRRGGRCRQARDGLADVGHADLVRVRGARHQEPAAHQGARRHDAGDHPFQPCAHYRFSFPHPSQCLPTDGPRPVRTPRGGPDKKESFGDERPIGDATPPPIGGTPAWRAGTCVRRPDCRRHA